MDFIREPDRIYAKNADGKLLAEITFPARDGVATIEHTFVDDSLRGQHIAEQLVREALDAIHSQQLEVRATCSYATAWLSKHPDQI